MHVLPTQCFWSNSFFIQFYKPMTVRKTDRKKTNAEIRGKNSCPGITVFVSKRGEALLTLNIAACFFASSTVQNIWCLTLKSDRSPIPVMPFTCVLSSNVRYMNTPNIHFIIASLLNPFFVGSKPPGKCTYYRLFLLGYRIFSKESSIWVRGAWWARSGEETWNLCNGL